MCCYRHGGEIAAIHSAIVLFRIARARSHAGTLPDAVVALASTVDGVERRGLISADPIVGGQNVPGRRRRACLEKALVREGHDGSPWVCP